MGTAIDTERGRIDNQVIMLKTPPFVAGIEIVVGRTASVCFADRINDACRFEVRMTLCHSCFSVVKVTMNEDTEQVRLITQYIVSTSADNDTTAL